MTRLELMPVRDLKPCGTYAAYARHVRRREIPDEACYSANRSYHRIRRHVAAGQQRQQVLLREVIRVLAEAMGVAP